MSSDNHTYDGIEEHDNPLPAWWLATFFLTIIFAGNYVLFFFSNTIPTQEQELAAEMAALPKATEKLWTEGELTASFSLPENIQGGQNLFAAKCMACHGDKGQGVIGPNLTDNFWLHGQGERKDIVETVQKGVVSNGMTAWAEVLSENEIVQVAAFVYSLKGTKPANAKAPQGTEAH